MGVLGMAASGVGSWSVGGRIIANVRLIYNLAVVGDRSLIGTKSASPLTNLILLLTVAALFRSNFGRQLFYADAD
jgi:hypothetical protein